MSVVCERFRFVKMLTLWFGVAAVGDTRTVVVVIHLGKCTYSSLDLIRGS